MKTKTWCVITAILVILGVVLFIVNYLVYVPRLTALEEALTKSRVTNTLPPNPQTFGLDNTSLIVSAVLRTFSISLIFVGASVLFIFFVAWIAQKLRLKR